MPLAAVLRWSGVLVSVVDAPHQTIQWSPPAPVGRDLVPDLCREPQAVLVYGVPPIVCRVRQTIIGGSHQRGILSIELRC